MVKRPLAVSIIAWIQIVSALFMPFALWRHWKMVHHPTPQELQVRAAMAKLMPKYSESLQVSQIILGAVVCFVVGFYLLRGKSWARTLFIAWTGVGLGISFFILSAKLLLLPSLLLSAIMVALLFTPKANLYFSSHVAQD